MSVGGVELGRVSVGGVKLGRVGPPSPGCRIRKGECHVGGQHVSREGECRGCRTREGECRGCRTREGECSGCQN